MKGRGEKPPDCSMDEEPWRGASVRGECRVSLDPACLKRFAYQGGTSR